MGQLSGRDDLQPGDRISVFAYGSGCQAEFYEGIIGQNAVEEAVRIGLARRLDERLSVSIGEYERLEKAREEIIDESQASVDLSLPAGGYERHYQGKGRLVFRGVDRFRRRYEFS